MTDSAGGVAVSFDPEQTVRTFTFDYRISVDLSGHNHVDYVIEV